VNAEVNSRVGHECSPDKNPTNPLIKIGLITSQTKNSSAEGLAA